MTRNHRQRHQAEADDGERSELPTAAEDVLPDIWSAWIRFGLDMTQQWMSLVQPGWQLPDLRAGDLLSAGTKQLTEHLARDPLLKLSEQVWNANPLRDVIPLDWASIAWALRTVWLRSFTRPDVLTALSEMNAAVDRI